MPFDPRDLRLGIGFQYDNFIFDVCHREQENKKKLMMEEQGFFECGQREDDDHPAFKADVDEEDHSGPRFQQTARKGTKRPYFPPVQASEDSDEPSSVDLEAYFDERGTPAKVRILLCRSYASYIAAQVREAKRKAE